MKMLLKTSPCAERIVLFIVTTWLSRVSIVVVSLERVSSFRSHGGQIFNHEWTFSSRRQILAVGFASIYRCAETGRQGRCNTDTESDWSRCFERVSLDLTWIICIELPPDRNHRGAVARFPLIPAVWRWRIDLALPISILWSLIQTKTTDARVRCIRWSR